MQKAFIVFGPPGAGKGTQAKFLAEYFKLAHFDTGRYLEEFFRNYGGSDPAVLREKENFDSGQLVDTTWLIKLINEEVSKLAQSGQGIVFSGSPRRMEEAFGKDGKGGLVEMLVREYGKENVCVFALDIPEEESIKRNSMRSVATKSGAVHKRSLDKPEVIKIRLGVYKEETLPVLKEMERQGMRVSMIDGMPPPLIVFQSILKTL